MTEGATPGRRTRWTAVFGTLSVVLSLGLVAWELNQNTIAVRAATYDRLAESATAYLWEAASNEELADLLRRAFAGDPRSTFSPTEITRLDAVGLAMITHLENSYRQYRAGVVGEDVFDSYGWNDGFFFSRFFREDWAVDSPTARLFDDEFVEFFDAHLEEMWGEEPAQ